MPWYAAKPPGGAPNVAWDGPPDPTALAASAPVDRPATATTKAILRGSMGGSRDDGVVGGFDAAVRFPCLGATGWAAIRSPHESDGSVPEQRRHRVRLPRHSDVG